MFGGALGPVISPGGPGGGAVVPPALGRGAATQIRRTASITAIETKTDVGTDPTDAVAKPLKAPTGVTRIIGAEVMLLQDIGSGNSQDAYAGVFVLEEVTGAKGGVVLATDGVAMNGQGTSTGIALTPCPWRWHPLDIPVDGGAGPIVSCYVTGTGAAPTGAKWTGYVKFYYA